MEKVFTPTHPEVICQVCGRPNQEEAEICRFCKAPLYVVSGVDRAEDFFEQVPAFSHLEDRLSLQEEREKELRGSLRRLAGEIERQGRTISILQSGFSTLKDLLQEKSLIAEGDFIGRWEKVLSDQLFLIEQRDKLLKKKDRIFSCFRGRNFKAFARTVEKAEFYFYSQNRERALEALLQALAADPRNPELNIFLGSLHLQEENLPLAARHLQKALHADPEHFEARFFLGLLKALSLDYSEAIRILESIRGKTEEPFLVHYTLGTLYVSLKRYAEAERELTAALGLEKNPQAAFALASVHYVRGKIPAALRLLEDLKTVREADEETLYLLGMCYLEKDWIKKAGQVFKELKALCPTKGRYQLALCLAQGWRDIPSLSSTRAPLQAYRRAEASLEDHRLETAWKVYRRLALGRSPHPLLQLGYAVLSHQTRRPLECIKACTNLLKTPPAEALGIPAFVTLLTVLRERGEYPQALGAAQRMAALCTSPYGRAYAYATWSLELAELDKNLSDASELADTALELAPEELRALAMDAKGWVLYKMGNYAGSLDQLKQSVRLDAHPSVLVHLGMAALAAGRKDESKEAFRSARKKQAQPDDLPFKLWHTLKLELRSKLA